jgi:hypothetical protein
MGSASPVTKDFGGKIVTKNVTVCQGATKAQRETVLVGHARPLFTEENVQKIVLAIMEFVTKVRSALGIAYFATKIGLEKIVIKSAPVCQKMECAILDHKATVLAYDAIQKSLGPTAKKHALVKEEPAQKVLVEAAFAPIALQAIGD